MTTVLMLSSIFYNNICTQRGYFTISNGIFKFNFLAAVVSEISGGPQIVQLTPQPSTQLLDEHASASYKQPSSTLSAFWCAWGLHCSTEEDSPLRSMQLCCRWAVNVKCATCTTTQRRTLCHVISSSAED